MKKFSLIAGLGCLATMGGVFAAWTFGNFSIVQPQGLEFTIEIETEIISNFHVTATATKSDAQYTISQNDAKNGIKLTRSSETDAENDVNFNVQLVNDDVYSITEKTIGITAKALFIPKNMNKDSLKDLNDGSNDAVVSGTVVYTDEVTLSQDKLVSDAMGFKLCNGALNTDFAVESKAKAKEYLDALDNTKLSYVITLTEVVA